MTDVGTWDTDGKPPDPRTVSLSHHLWPEISLCPLSTKGQTFSLLLFFFFTTSSHTSHTPCQNSPHTLHVSLAPVTGAQRGHDLFSRVASTHHCHHFCFTPLCSMQAAGQVGKDVLAARVHTPRVQEAPLPSPPHPPE